MFMGKGPRHAGEHTRKPPEYVHHLEARTFAHAATPRMSVHACAARGWSRWSRPAHARAQKPATNLPTCNESISHHMMSAAPTRTKTANVVDRALPAMKPTNSTSICRTRTHAACAPPASARIPTCPPPQVPGIPTLWEARNQHAAHRRPRSISPPAQHKTSTAPKKLPSAAACTRCGRPGHAKNGACLDIRVQAP